MSEADCVLVTTTPTGWPVMSGDTMTVKSVLLVAKPALLLAIKE